MAENPQPERTSAPPAWLQRIRTKMAGAGDTARRTMERLPGRNRSAVEEKPAPEVKGASAAPPGDPAIGLWAAVKRARLALLIIVTVAQVVGAVMAWRIKVGRARRRGEPIDL